MTAPTQDTGAAEVEATQEDRAIGAQAEAINQEEKPQDIVESHSEPENPVLSDREAKMAKIAARRLEEIKSGQPEEKVEEQEKQEEQPVNPKRKLKVNGEEVEVDEDEIIRLAQLRMAEGDKFRTAKKDAEEAVSKELREMREQLEALSAKSNLPAKDDSEKALPDKDAPQPLTTDAFDKAVFGGDEEAQQARQLMIDRMNSEPVDPRQIAAEVRAEMRREAAIQSVSDSDPIAKQMIEDERMAQVVDQYSGMLLNLEPNLSETENLSKAVKQALMHFPELSPPPSKPTAQVSTTKQAHAAGNVTTPAQRINIAPTPLSEAEYRAKAKASMKENRA